MHVDTAKQRTRISIMKMNMSINLTIKEERNDDEKETVMLYISHKKMLLFFLQRRNHPTSRLYLKTQINASPDRTTQEEIGQMIMKIQVTTRFI